MNKHTAGTFHLLVVGMLLFWLAACKSDIEKINALTNNSEQATVTYYNVEFEYTDTAKLQAKLITPKVDYFLNNEEPYYEFPTGIKVLFYDGSEEIKSVITSKYAIYRLNTQLFEVRDSVVSRSIQDNQIVESEQMFWDQRNKLIYSNVFTKISDNDGVHFGEKGFEAAQDLSYYKLFGSSGNVRVKDEE